MPIRLPTIHTWRLKLRPFAPEDAPAVQGLAGDPQMASTLPDLPQPYTDGLAEQWIASHRARAVHEQTIILAVVRREDDLLMGAVELRLNRRHGQAELGFWIGRAYWDQGYATEAARAVVRYAFSTLGLHRISARHLARNLPSGKVLRKIGMSAEGFRRQSVLVNNVFEDEVEYGMTKAEMPEAGWKAVFNLSYDAETLATETVS